MKFILLAILTLACSTKSPKSKWHGDNEKKLTEYIESRDKKQPSVAIFDWDNTVAKNDVGDAVMFWMISNNLIQKPKSWKLTSRWLRKHAVEELERNCTDLRSIKCIDTILSFYVDGKGWKESFNKETMEPAYAWLASLLAGYSKDEIKKIATDAIEFNLSNPVGELQVLGSKTYPAYLRIYQPMKHLIQDLKDAGVDVWIVSASPQAVVEVFGAGVGITPDKVIGIRNTVDSHGKYTANFEGCGPYAAGNQEIITFRQGKRCSINKYIFNMKKGSDQISKRSPISFAAGDSDTDATFLKDAHDLHLVINRNKPEVMCHAYANKDGKWIINPMFIEPKAVKKEPYQCKKYGLEDQKDLSI
ncbi:MAG TPA: haloacid dehalogenase-like hydrolase [Bacteriovoracaceae bacterium]|nr:haloacid dehalogenase-like hydrolase [Bacteriovoracaceae bacterium]